MPRAAMSVATMIFACPDLKLAIAFSRCPCDRFPCSDVAPNPDFVSWSASFFALCFVLVNTRV